MALLLLEKGRSLNAIDNAGAATRKRYRFHHTEMIELLMAKGAKISVRTGPV